MLQETKHKLEQEFHEMIGAVNILDIMRVEMEQWLEEAQDESKHEALENVLNHIGALEAEYQVRRENLQNSLQKAGI
jgi:uncharacterized membrane protein YgaE (UPF0421/DUF939 family)